MRIGEEIVSFSRNDDMDLICPKCGSLCVETKNIPYAYGDPDVYIYFACGYVILSVVEDRLTRKLHKNSVFRLCCGAHEYPSVSTMQKEQLRRYVAKLLATT